MLSRTVHACVPATIAILSLEVLEQSFELANSHEM